MSPTIKVEQADKIDSVGLSYDLVAIVGPTASGKSALALKVAKLVASEIICADSRTIYKGMDIGTAKPTKDDQDLIPHWGLDLIEPGQSYSAHQFKSYANHAIKAIHNRKKLPLLVGGTGLYIDSILYDFSFRPALSSFNRQELEKLSVKDLQQIVINQGLPLPQNSQNKRHLIRTIEAQGVTSKRSALRKNYKIIGLVPPNEQLKEAIRKRVLTMYESGFTAEVKRLKSVFGQDFLTTAGIGYKSCLDYIEGKVSLEHAQEIFARSDWQYARRQKTWFKRNPDILWFEDQSSALLYIKTVLGL